ncbi:MAG: hypothetical protein NTX52_13380, partial [Planctomycetota bacterium]|nr:hypothetical protein [Planctomycetota bacterium]
MFTPVLRCNTCGFIAEISDVHNNTREHDCSKFSEASKSLHKQSAAMPPARNGIVNAEQYLNEALGGNMNI